MSSVQFRAELTDFKMVHHVLKATAFKEFAVLQPMEEGLKITVDDMKCVETTVYIPSNVFNSYYIDPSISPLKISLKVLTECLHIYGDDGSPSLKMSYKNIGSPLCLVMKHNEENISVDCEIQTIDVGDYSDISLAAECTACKIVMDAAPFVELLMDLDQASDEFELLLSPDPPYFRITATSLAGESVIDISKHSDMVTVFQCNQSTKSSYAFNYIRQILKVMTFANKVSISTSDTGLLAFQLVINTNEQQLYVEYYVTALFGL